MNYGEYHHSVNCFDRENFEKIIRDSRRFPEFSQELRKRKIKYEYRNKEYAVKSKIRAVQSRNEFQNLSVKDEILLRLYGKFALILNRSMRTTKSKKTLMVSDYEKLKRNVDRYFRINKINSLKIISRMTAKEIIGGLSFLDSLPAIYLTNGINQLIAKHRSEHVDTDYFYRISRAKRNIYMTPEEASKLPLNNRNIIKLGNIVMDKAITSVGDDLQSILFRYSHKGQNATHKKNPVNVIEEEEILYVIKNNEKLNYMDIAGFKLNKPEINVNGRFELDPNNKLSKGQDEFSSGELIIPSHTPFRVVGIQKMDRTMNRILVFLEPVKLEDINQRDIVQNNFNGEPFSSNSQFNLEEFTA